jgi:hypothetical protein
LAVRALIDSVVEDMVAGRESWRVMALMSSAALAITAWYVW